MSSNHSPVGWMLAALTLCPAMAPRADVAAPRSHATQPQNPPRTLTLHEEWRIGGAGSMLLGAVTEATSDADGNVYLLDTQLCHVVVVSPGGEVLRTIGREGDGPGEVRRPRDVLVLADGSIGLVELFPARIVKLSPEGEPRGTVAIGGSQVPPGGFMAANQCLARAGVLLAAGQQILAEPAGQKRILFLSSLTPTGEEALRLRESTMLVDFNKLRFVERELSPPFHLATALGPDGRVFVPESWDGYAIEVIRPDGTLEQVIERDFENRRRTEDELRRIHAVYEASARESPYKQESVVEPCPPAISALRVDAGGRLWVLHSRSADGQPAGIMQSYDIFAPDGRYLEQVAIACPGDPEMDGLEFLGDDRVLWIKGYALAAAGRTDLGSVPLGEDGEPQPQEIICCRLGS